MFIFQVIGSESTKTTFAKFFNIAFTFEIIVKDGTITS